MKPSPIDRCPKCGAGLILRSPDQNRKLHAVLHDVARQKQWAGEYRDVETWKRLFISAYEREQKNAPVMLPAIDGQGVDFVYRRSSRMSKQEMVELVDFATAWALDNGVELSDMPPLEAA